MSDNATLVERLRDAANWMSDGVGIVPGPEVCDEAAARIAELEAELDRLKISIGEAYAYRSLPDAPGKKP